MPERGSAERAQESDLAIEGAHHAASVENEIRKNFELIHATLMRMCCRILSRADAEDCVMVSIEQGLAKPEMFRGESKLITWLARIAINRALDMRRSKFAREIPESRIEQTVEDAERGHGYSFLNRQPSREDEITTIQRIDDKTPQRGAQASHLSTGSHVP
jgi:DNA-directed RNA polymerase specialized sigma24 family protein